MIGKVGRVTGKIGPGLVGEVVILIRGGSEAFYAYPANRIDVIDVGEQVLVIDHTPPRSVHVERWNILPGSQTQ